eukprot:13056969-Alexandrium_andersonii.AAC.1
MQQPIMHRLSPSPQARRAPILAFTKFPVLFPKLLCAAPRRRRARSPPSAPSRRPSRRPPARKRSSQQL